MDARGGPGNDLLEGNGGRDLLIGDGGADRLDGGEDDDIVIAGFTSFDGNEAALAAIMAEWTSERDWLTRVQNLGDGSGSADRQNGNYFLRQCETVYKDGDDDVLALSSGMDLLYFDPPGDRLTDLLDPVFAADFVFMFGEEKDGLPVL